MSLSLEVSWNESLPYESVVCERGDELTESVAASWGGASGCCCGCVCSMFARREKERGERGWCELEADVLIAGPPVC